MILVALGSLTMYPGSLNGSLQDQIYPPSSSPYGLPHKNWGIAHWQWWLSIPKEIAPFPDPAKWTYDCFIGLGYPVAMLANPIIDAETPNVTYDCTIPRDRAILIEGITEFCYYGQGGPGGQVVRTDEDLKKCVVYRNDHATHEILIDGKKVENIDQYRVTTDFFNMTIPDGNMFGFPAGTYRALLDGTWLMLKPLPPGNHTIETKIVQIMPPGQEQDNLDINVIYNLHVV